jgi:hypothetical protein
MVDLTHAVDSPAQLAAAAADLRQAVAQQNVTPNEVLEVFEAWVKALGARELDAIPGVPFLRLWLRRGTLEPIIARELGSNALHGGWTNDGRARLKAFPLGVVGHWPAGNVEIQPILSMTCSLLGGNAALVRVPSGLVDVTRRLVNLLSECDGNRLFLKRIYLANFDHDRNDLQQAMAQEVDGAMIWGSKEAVLNVRGLPFPFWARLAVFGPRLSVAAMDAATWSNQQQHDMWCQRIARDVWQFDQQACSSPQTLFLEKCPGRSPQEFVAALERAFATENRAHPRRAIPTSLASAICQARASWLLQNAGNRAIFPKKSPDWTLLLGSGNDLPAPTQGKTLAILEVDNLLEPISKFDGNVQTLGLAMADPDKEAQLTDMAAKRGVDRVVKLGRMHVFLPPWDGVDLIRPMVRMVRHVDSAEP